MVRLKGLNSEGSQLNLQRISIPYGAIKRYFFASSNVLKYLFQFLMVRLKDPCHQIWTNENYISIPYGAIKSEHNTMLDIYIQDFNSLWCD